MDKPVVMVHLLPMMSATYPASKEPMTALPTTLAILQCSKVREDVRGNWSTTEGGLPVGIDDITSFVRRAIVFAKLWDADDQAASLVIETDCNQSPNAVDTPEEVDVISLDGLPL